MRDAIQYGFRFYSSLETAFSQVFFPCLSYWLYFFFYFIFWWNLVTLLMCPDENNTPHCFCDNYFVVVFMLLWLLISLLCSFFFLLSPNIELHPLFFIFYRLFLDDLSWSQSLYLWDPKICIFSHFLTPNSYVQRCLKFDKFKPQFIFPLKSILAAILADLDKE